MLGSPVKFSLLPCRSDNAKNMDNQQGVIMIGNITKSKFKQWLKEFGSIPEISRITGIPKSTLYYYKSKYRLNINKFKKRFPYSKEELVLLHEKYGSITKVASSLLKPYSTVRHWYNSFDIVFNSSSMTVYQELRNTPMSQLHKSVLVGSMLGDGGIWLAPHCKNARLYVCHCELQKEYLAWVHGLLQPFSRPIVPTEKAGEKEIGGNIVNCSNFYRFYTIAHPDITDLYKTYYVNNYKHVDSTVIEKVDLLAMSIWFCDDGSIQRYKGVPVSCSIATNSFPYKEQLILVEAIRKFFNGKIKIKPNSGEYNGKKREDFTIEMYGGRGKIKDFLDMIKLVVPKCIHYKLS
jgi:hypothetical protein